MRSLWKGGYVLLLVCASCATEKRIDRSGKPWRGQDWRGPFLDNSGGYLTQTADVLLSMGAEGDFAIDFTDGRAVSGKYVDFFDGIINWDVRRSTYSDLRAGETYETTFRYGGGQFVINFPSGQLVTELARGEKGLDQEIEGHPVAPHDGRYLCAGDEQTATVIIRAPEFFVNIEGTGGLVIASGRTTLEDASMIRLDPTTTSRGQALPPLRMATGSNEVPLILPQGWGDAEAATLSCNRGEG